MATPLSADRLLAALRAEGVKVVEYKSWRTHNRNSKGAWGSVNGVMIHHTAGSNSLALCYSGRSDLPGPLCHTHLSKAGLATMVGHGRANHAGGVAANAHAAVVAESSTHPRPDVAEPVDGNARYYGLEIENLGTGKDPYPAVQYDQAVRWAAGVCRAHGWSEGSVIGHKEATRRKIDPSFDMNDFRRAVADRLRHPASWSPDGGAANPTPEEDDMPLTAAEIDRIAERVWKRDFLASAPEAAVAGNPTVSAETWLTYLGKRARDQAAELAAQRTTIQQLAAALATQNEQLDPDALIARIESAIENVTVRLDVTP